MTEGSAAFALRRALDDCALADRADLARLRADGPDFLDLLHRLSTNDVSGLAPGQGAATVLTTAKGRIVDRLFVHRLAEDDVVVVGGPGRAEAVLAHLTRYTFAERTGLRDVTGTLAHWALLGPRARERARAAGLPEPGPLGAVSGAWRDTAVVVLGHDGASAEGVSVLVARDSAAPAAEALAAVAGGAVLAQDGVEAWRVLRGLPGPAELDVERNPLEAGLWDAVSFTKGCYVGQEVVARLRTYDKVVRALVRLELDPGSEVPLPGTALVAEDRTVGTVTSAVLPPGADAPAALGYVRREAAVPGRRLQLALPDGARAGATVAGVTSSRAA